MFYLTYSTYFQFALEVPLLLLSLRLVGEVTDVCEYVTGVAVQYLFHLQKVSVGNCVYDMHPIPVAQEL